MGGIAIASFLYYVVVPYVLAVMVSRITDAARFARVSRAEIPEDGLDELPSDEEPALLARVVSEDGFVPSGFTATVAELERRGVVTIERVPSPLAGLTLDEAREEPECGERERSERVERERGKVVLANHEFALAERAEDAHLSQIELTALEMLFADGSRKITSKRLAKWRADNPAPAKRLVAAFAQAVDERLGERHLVEGVSESFLDVVAVLVAIYYVAGVVVVGTYLMPLMFLGLPGIVAALSFSRPREVYTEEGHALLVRCRAFARHLARERLPWATLEGRSALGKRFACGIAVRAITYPVSELDHPYTLSETPAAPAWYVPYAQLHGKGRGTPPVPPPSDAATRRGARPGKGGPRAG